MRSERLGSRRPRSRWERSLGVGFDPRAGFSPDDVAARLQRSALELIDAHVTLEGIDYASLKTSRQFQNFVDIARRLPDIDGASVGDAFWINLYNAMVLHATVVLGPPEDTPEARTAFFSGATGATYEVADHVLSLDDVEHALLRRSPAGDARSFAEDDARRRTFAPTLARKFDNRIHFALNCGASSCPPVKLFRAGVRQDDILAILRTNSRLPLSVYGDLNAQVSALDLGHGRLTALLDEYGDDTIAAVFAELRARAHLQMQTHISALPDGAVAATDYLDNDGINDVALAVAVDVRVAGDRMVLDFSRSADQCAGPVNISRSTAIAACYVALKHLFPDVPANAGVLDPVDIIIPDGSLLSASAPKPVGGYTERSCGSLMLSLPPLASWTRRGRRQTPMAQSTPCPLPGIAMMAAAGSCFPFLGADMAAMRMATG